MTDKFRYDPKMAAEIFIAMYGSGLPEKVQELLKPALTRLLWDTYNVGRLVQKQKLAEKSNGETNSTQPQGDLQQKLCATGTTLPNP